MDEQQYVRHRRSSKGLHVIAFPAGASRSTPPARSWPRAEYAAPLVPSWVVAAIALAVLVLAAQPWRNVAARSIAAPRVQAIQATRSGICGPGWQVQRLGPNDYDLYVVSAGTARACMLPLAGGLSEIYVHASGQGAVLSDGLTGQQGVPIAVGPWWSIPINPQGDTLAVRPALTGVDLALTVRTPHP